MVARIPVVEQAEERVQAGDVRAVAEDAEVGQTEQAGLAVAGEARTAGEAVDVHVR